METRARRRSGGALAARNPNAAAEGAVPGAAKRRRVRQETDATAAAHGLEGLQVPAPAAGSAAPAPAASSRGADNATGGVSAPAPRGRKRRRSREPAPAVVEAVVDAAVEVPAAAAAGAAAPAPSPVRHPAKKPRGGALEDEDPVPATQDEDAVLPATGGAAAPAPAAAAGAGGEAAWTDIDAAVAKEANQFVAYAPHVYEHLKELEVRYHIEPAYCRVVQSDIKPKMRAVLVDWLVEVIEEYRLLPESLYAAVQYLDRFLSLRSVSRGRLQLLGCACMLIAAKFEEIYMPMVDEFVYITDNAYDRAAILAMEQEVLSALDFRVKCATPKHFMTRFLHAAGAGKWDMTTNITKYLCELSLLEYRFLEYRPSQITAAAILVARRIQGMPEWNATLEHYTGFTVAQLEACARDLSKLHADAEGLPIQAVFQKYTHSPYMRVAKAVQALPLPEGYEGRPSCTFTLKGNTY